jgi:hypothetical protein
MFEETLYFIANGWAVQDQMIFVDYMKDGVPSAGVLEYEKHRDSEYR